MVAKRGIMFEFQTSVSPAAAKAFEALEKRAEELQKRMNLTLNVVERGRRNGSNGHGTNGNGTNGSAAVSNADIKAAERAAQARERAAERAFRTEARWNRQAEAAIARRARDEARAADQTERAARRAADAQVRELQRVERERQRVRAAEFREAAVRQRTEARRGFRSDADFWRSFEQYGDDRSRTRIQQEREQQRQQQRQQRQEESERRAAERDYNNRLRAGNRQLSQLVRNGPQAIAHDERIVRQERERAERETELAQRRQQEAQNRIREGVYGTVHAFGQLTRAAAQFGLVGQRDMSRVLDTIFAVEGSINALQGVMGAARAIGGMRAARGLAGRAVGGAGLGTLGLAGAGIGAAALGTAGLAGAMIDRNRGVAGNVGGVWDTIGGAINAPIGFVNRGLMGIGSKIERSFNASYGLTQFQNEERSLRLHEAEFKRDFGAEEGKNESYYAAKKRADLAEERTQLMERRTRAKIDARAQMRDLRSRIDSEIVPLEMQQRGAVRQAAEERHAIRMGNVNARGANIAGQLGQSFGRQQAAHGLQAGLLARQAAGEFVDPKQLLYASEEQARQEGRVTALAERQRNNVLTAQNANFQRGSELGRDLTAARQRLGETGEFDNTKREMLAREVLEIEEKIKENEREGVEIASRKRQIEIDGAQRELQLRQETVAAAKEAAQALRQQKQSAMERFGQLNPMEQRATIEAAKMFKQGVRLQEPQLNLLRRFGDVFAPELRERDVKNAKEGGFDQLLGLSRFSPRLAGAEAREQKEINVTARAQNEINIKLDANTEAMAKEITDRLEPIIKSLMGTVVNSIAQQLRMAQGNPAFAQGAEKVGAAGGF